MADAGVKDGVTGGISLLGASDDGPYRALSKRQEPAGIEELSRPRRHFTLDSHIHGLL